MRQVTRHSERWDLGRCSPPARLAWTARRAAWSATQAALDAKDAGGAPHELKLWYMGCVRVRCRDRLLVMVRQGRRRCAVRPGALCHTSWCRVHGSGLHAGRMLQDCSMGKRASACSAWLRRTDLTCVNSLHCLGNTRICARMPIATFRARQTGCGKAHRCVASCGNEYPLGCMQVTIPPAFGRRGAWEARRPERRAARHLC